MTSPTTLPAKYTVRRKALTLVGAKLHVRAEDDRLLAYTEMKAWKLKEDIRVYADEEKRAELLSIQARQIIDFSASYDVTDSTTGQKVGALRRKGVKSIFRDEWHILDTTDRQIAIVQEDSFLKAAIRRLITPLIPQSYHITVGERTLGRCRQHFNPFIFKLDVDMSEDLRKEIDPRLALATAILLGVIEGRQR